MTFWLPGAYAPFISMYFQHIWKCQKIQTKMICVYSHVLLVREVVMTFCLAYVKMTKFCTKKAFSWNFSCFCTTHKNVCFSRNCALAHTMWRYTCNFFWHFKFCFPRKERIRTQHQKCIFVGLSPFFVWKYLAITSLSLMTTLPPDTNIWTKDRHFSENAPSSV
jgi:hypothetical protein